MASKTDTFMPLYIGDYLRDTMRLTTEQHGAYLLLLMATWIDGGSLPDDDEELAAITKMPLKSWRSARRKLEPFFEIDDGEWRQGRVSRELAKADGMAQAKAEAGRKGAQKRWQKDSTAIAEPLANGCQIDAPSPSHSRTDSSLRSESGAAAPSVDPPEDDLLKIPDELRRVEPEDVEASFYRRGKDLLGLKAGGVLTKLKAALNGDLARCHELVTRASKAENPMEFVQACIRNNGPPAEIDYEAIDRELAEAKS